MHRYKSNTDSDSDDGCRSSEVTGSGLGMNNRRRRRGLIEKRRRDRINTSLSELKRLVPSALEKSGSAKLEKAEILQMTVEHLKYLQNNPGYAHGGYDLQQQHHQQKLEYHAMGIRECAAEVSRYLVTIEGLDVQDPLRLRISSHLQMFAAQRTTHHQPPTPPSPLPHPHHHNHQHHHPHHQSWNYNYSYPETKDTTVAAASLFQYQHVSDGYSSTTSSATTVPTATTATAVVPSTSSSASSTSASTNSQTALTISSPSLNDYYHGFQNQQTSPVVTSTINYSGSKPYRPWGAEMAC